MFAQNRDSLFQQNHLTPVRWCLALMVMVGHAWFTATGFEPLRIHQWSGSYLAVNGFFILSGLLIAKSLNGGGSRVRFVQARLLRIMPGLAFLLLAYLLYFGPLFTSPEARTVHALDYVFYVLRVLTLQDPEATPGTIFASNTLQAFNGALWTIRFEIIAYFITAALVWLRLIRGPWTACLAAIGFLLAYWLLPLLSDSSALRAGLRLMSAFSMGIVIWYVPFLRQPGWLYTGMLVMLFLAFGWSFVGELLGNLALAALILKAGLPEKASAEVERLPDYSYGIYLWHYPIMQVILVLIPDLHPWLLFAAALPLTLVFAAISWTFVERPALKLKDIQLAFGPFRRQTNE